MLVRRLVFQAVSNISFIVGFTDDVVQNFVVITWPRSLEDHIGAFTIAALRQFQKQKTRRSSSKNFQIYFEEARISHCKDGSSKCPKKVVDGEKVLEDVKAAVKQGWLSL